MKIANSIMQAAATGTYVSQESTGSGIDVIRRDNGSAMTERYDRKGELTRPETEDNPDLFSELLGNVYTKTGNYAAPSAGSSASVRNTADAGLDTTAFRNRLLGTLFNRLFRTVAVGSAVGGVLTQTRLDAYEYEDMDFAASGEVHTEDGRSIAFDIRLFLSREVAKMTQVSVPAVASVLRDPLIVNLKTATAEIGRQTFRFDLDADGEEEEIALPGKGSAFLALDKNGDGRIGDGSELFGAMTGDGFGELREYDSDGNGWIDENDEVFSRLRVWYKNGDGDEELVDLGAADIGAIWLGEQETSFHIKDLGDQLRGMIRSTGIFLKESGGVGTIQHVDLAVGAETGSQAAEDAAVGGENFVSGFGTGGSPLHAVLALLNGRNSDTAGTDTDEQNSTVRSDTETKETDDRESAARRRKEAAEEKERKKAEAAERRAEKKRRNEEFAEKARKRREEEEERVEQLFEERAERREAAEQAHGEAVQRRRAFDAEWAEKRGRKLA